VTAISETLYRDLRFSGSPVGVSVLCPGFVRTGIGESERTRPHWAPKPDDDPAAAVVRDVIHQLVAGGIEPNVVADRVFDAVRSDTFYILTHEHSRPMVEARMVDILEGRFPSDMPVV
jgi:short-subunit dehydrogenase